MAGLFLTEWLNGAIRFVYGVAMILGISALILRVGFLHAGAQPEIHALAALMYKVRAESIPQLLKPGFWHLPFVDGATRLLIRNKFGVECLQDSQEAIELAIKVSVARCARVSYLNHDGTTASFEDEVKLYNRLLSKPPIHASPAEHQAMSLPSGTDYYSGNLRAWRQYRKTLKNENITKYEAGLFSNPS